MFKDVLSKCSLNKCLETMPFQTRLNIVDLGSGSPLLFFYPLWLANPKPFHLLHVLYQYRITLLKNVRFWFLPALRLKIFIFLIFWMHLGIFTNRSCRKLTIKLFEILYFLRKFDCFVVIKLCTLKNRLIKLFPLCFQFHFNLGELLANFIWIKLN